MLCTVRFPKDISFSLALDTYLVVVGKQQDLCCNLLIRVQGLFLISASSSNPFIFGGEEKEERLLQCLQRLELEPNDLELAYIRSQNLFFGLVAKMS